MTLLPPGFRFHPTDVELIKYYLKRKLLGKRIAFDAIAEVDIYKFAPWDLPGKSRLDGGDRKWYFFCSVKKKYGCGVKSNRSTGSGYWKSTGKDRPVSCGDSVVGMVKTLVFHMGKSPKGERTDWVMYEYRIERKELGDCGAAHDGFVLCAVFKKDGLGPRVGAHYGALFREEDWDINENEDEENCTNFSGEAAAPCAALMAAVDSRNCSSPSLDNLAVCSFEPCPPVPDAHASWPPYVPSGHDDPLLDLPQIARENDDILSMLAMFGEDDTSHLSGQVKDRVDCGNTCTNSASNDVDIYFGLEDLENIGPLADSIYNISGPCSAKDSTDQLYGEAQFLELMDFDVPHSYSKDAAQDETLEADTFVDYHNYGSDTQQPYYLLAADANIADSFIESATVCDQQNGGNRKVDLLCGIPSVDNVNSATRKVQVESGDAQKSFSRGDDPHSSGIMFCHYDGSSTHVKAEVTRTIIGSTKDALPNKLGESPFTFLEVEFGKGTASSNTGVTLMFILFCIIAIINRHLRSLSYCVVLQQSLLFIWFICRGSSVLHVMSSVFHHVDECASFGLTMCLLLFNCCFLSFHFGCYLEGYNLSVGSKAKVRNACVSKSF